MRADGCCRKDVIAFPESLFDLAWTIALIPWTGLGAPVKHFLNAVV
jgi:hypothetical protein